MVELIEAMPMIFVPASKRGGNAQYRLTLSTTFYTSEGVEQKWNAMSSQVVYNGDVPAIGTPEFPENTYDEIAFRLATVLLTRERYGLASPTTRDVVIVKHVPSPTDLERITDEAESEIEDMSISIYQVPGSALTPIAQTELMETIPLTNEKIPNLFGFVFRVSMSPAHP